MHSVADLSSRAFEQLARDGLEPTPSHYARAFAAAAAEAGLIAARAPRPDRPGAANEMAHDLRAVADQAIKAAARLRSTLANAKGSLKQQIGAAVESSEPSTLAVVRASACNVANVIGAVAAVSAERMALAVLHGWAASAGYARADVPTEAELGRYLHARSDAVQMLRADLARARRRKEPISVAMVGLRRVPPPADAAPSPEIGHDSGAYWYLGEVLKSAARRNDLVARMSGNCFLLVLGEAGAQTARLALRRYFAAHQRGIPVLSAGFRMVAGLAEWDGREDHDALIARAAVALRTARAGRRDAILARGPVSGEPAAAAVHDPTQAPAGSGAGKAQAAA